MQSEQTVKLDHRVDGTDILPPLDEGEGWSHKGCAWDNAPCGEVATHFISNPCTEHGRAHASDSRLFCARHYALTLLHTIEVEMPFQSAAFDDLVLEHGPL